jgi:hypothetical protein
MTQLRATLQTLNGTLGIAKPTLAVIRAGAPLVRPALSELVALSSPALTLLRQAPTLLADANAALPSISRFSVTFSGVLEPILAAARQVVPVINYIGLMHRETTDAFANLPALLNASAPASNGITKYLRAALTINNESLFGQAERPSTNRHNAYVSPGELANIARGGLESSDCNNTANAALPLGGANIPCRLQPAYPWPSNTAPGAPTYFPHLTEARR